MKEKDPLPEQTLQDIKQLMERSSRFISLSGLSGVAAGICALAGAWVAYGILQDIPGKTNYPGNFRLSAAEDRWTLKLLGVAAVTFFAAFVSAFLLTWKKAKKDHNQLWGPTSKRLMWNVMIPIVTGGIFILGMLEYNEWRFVAPACLIFYGLALINGSKYTLSDIRYLGYLQIILGLVNTWFIGYGLYFWATGFGVLHILYGIAMWWKYERN